MNIIQDSNFQIPTWRVVLKSHRDTDSCVFCNATPLQVRKSVIPFELRLDKEVEKKKKGKRASICRVISCYHQAIKENYFMLNKNGDTKTKLSFKYLKLYNSI